MKAKSKIVVGAVLTPLLVGIPVLVSGIKQYKNAKQCQLESDLAESEWTECRKYDNKSEDFEVKSETHVQNNFYPGLPPPSYSIVCDTPYQIRQ